jgi:hypothetical protein
LVEFARESNGFLLENRDIDAPLATADPVMMRHVQLYLWPLLAQTQMSVSAKTRRLVFDLLVSRRASADLAASSLSMTRRTLHRRLAEDGETFSST